MKISYVLIGLALFIFLIFMFFLSMFVIRGLIEEKNWMVGVLVFMVLLIILAVLLIPIGL